jgi:hypothetical protein
MKTRTKVMIMIIGVFVMMLSSIYLPIAPEHNWHVMAEYNPGAGAGGFMRIIIKQLPAAGSLDYTLNSTFTVNMTDTITNYFYKNIAYNTKFVIVVRARFNATECYCSSNSTWVLAWARCRITCTGLGIGTDIVMNRTEIAHGGATSFMWVNFYKELNATNLPLKLIRDQTCPITAIKLEAYW